MSGFPPAGYVHVCDAVARWAELRSLPVAVPPPRTPNRSLWRPRGEDWERARDDLRQELYAGNVPAFDFDQASGGLRRIEPGWWGGHKAGMVLDGAEGTNRGYADFYPTVLVPEGELHPGPEAGTAAPGEVTIPLAETSLRYRGYSDADAPFIERVRRLMDEDASLSAWAAILALGDELPGRGGLESRRKRVHAKFTKLEKAGNQNLETSGNNCKD